MKFYLEASAVAKLLFVEPESEAFRRFIRDLDEQGIDLVSSFLLETELRRSAVRLGAPQDLVSEVISRFDLIELAPSVFRQAGVLPGDNLRSLDALHLAAAMMAEADIMVTYDLRQIEACRAVGLRTESPS